MRGITLFLFCALAVCALSYWYIANGYVLPSQKSFHPSTLAVAPHISPVPTSLLAPQSIHSPDGTKKLTLTITTRANGGALYTVVASDISGGSSVPIFATTLPQNESLSIPDNTWSPDNAYVFLKESTTKGQQVFVFHADGKPFANGSTYLDVVPLFAARDFAYRFVDATGWADPTLLILETSTQGGQKGPLFWFVVPSSGFLQLAR